jgi:glycosyltransferase involved in cell wall biosynthesis
MLSASEESSTVDKVAVSQSTVLSSKQQVETDNSQIAKLLSQNQQLVAQKQALEEQLKLILNSKSWRVTAPIRLLTEFKRKVCPLFRFTNHLLDVQPLAALRTLKGSTNVTHSFEVSGTSPSLSISSNHGYLPSGWCLFRSTLNSSQSHLSSFLYYQTDAGFTSNERVLVESQDGQMIECLIKLPTPVKALKLDPFDIKSPFSFEHISIKEIGTAQLIYSLMKKHLWSQISRPEVVLHRIRKGFNLIREGGFVALRVKLFADDLTNNYQEWVRRFDTIGDKEREKIRALVRKLEYRPLVSILMPTYNTPEKWLRAAIDSVRAQAYENWELCIADDASPQKQVREVLAEYQKQDSRIKVVFREKNGHIAAASNSALEVAQGEFVGLLDHDDELTEDALAIVVAELNQNRQLDLIYSDEDMKTSLGMRYNPHFKSDWNPELLLSQNYVCHFSVFRRSIMNEVAGFRLGTEGAQDWDLIWRVADATTPDRIKHIPHVLYHWRAIEGSTAQSTDFKPYVLEAQKRSVAEHLRRKGVEGAEIEILRDIAHLRVHFPLPTPLPLVSLIIPTRDKVGILKVCVDSILKKTSYAAYEVIIVDNGSVEAETHNYFEMLKGDSRVRVIQDQLPFNFSRINNDAVKVARGELLGFLNNDLEVINAEWLSELVAQAARPEIGAVGAQLWFPSNLLQHGGIVLGIGGVAGHNHKGRRRGDPGYFNRIILPQNLSAVTAACLLMRRSIFDEIKGFDQDLEVAFNDVDLCLRVGAAGYQVIYHPYAQLYHHESASRGYENTPEKFVRFESEIEKMKQRWGDALRVDPFYNPNLTLLSEDFAFAFPPRLKKPWAVRGERGE